MLIPMSKINSKALTVVIVFLRITMMDITANVFIEGRIILLRKLPASHCMILTTLKLNPTVDIKLQETTASDVPNIPHWTVNG
jgi:hypothetical protein